MFEPLLQYIWQYFQEFLDLVFWWFQMKRNHFPQFWFFNFRVFNQSTNITWVTLDIEWFDLYWLLNGHFVSFNQKMASTKLELIGLIPIKCFFTNKFSLVSAKINIALLLNSHSVINRQSELSFYQWSNQFYWVRFSSSETN